MTDTHVRKLRVQQKTWESEGVVSVSLVDPSGADLPAWLPGAHLCLRLPSGLTREYSLCSDPTDLRRWTVAVLRTAESRGGSRFVHDELQVGALIEVEGPRNNFELHDAESYVLIAGGIGITPIIAMARQLEQRGLPWSLLYAGRSRASMAFLDELTALPRERVLIHAKDEANGIQADIAGAVSTLAPGSLVYVCGPERLTEAVTNAVGDASQLRLERFKAPGMATDPTDTDEAFDVICQNSGQRITVAPDVSVLDALSSAGVSVPSSCTEGICGTCEVGVIRGDVDHRDFLLTPEEQTAGKSMFVCVSRCRSAELVLDL